MLARLRNLTSLRTILGGPCWGAQRCLGGWDYADAAPTTVLWRSAACGATPEGIADASIMSLSILWRHIRYLFCTIERRLDPSLPGRCASSSMKRGHHRLGGATVRHLVDPARPVSGC